LVSIGTVLTKCGWHQVTAPKTYAGDIKAFAKAVPSGKTFIYALQMSIKHLALLKAFRQTVFQNRTSSSCKPLRGNWHFGSVISILITRRKLRLNSENLKEKFF